jgi:hypothetical protein
MICLLVASSGTQPIALTEVPGAESPALARLKSRKLKV